MFWVIRGTDRQTQDDFAFVVETPSQAAAEAWALKRGMPVAFLGPATEEDVLAAKQIHRLWRYSPEPRMTCFGMPILKRQVACLLLAGVATAGLVWNRTWNRPPLISPRSSVSTRGQRPSYAPPSHGRRQSAEFHANSAPREA